MKCWWTIFQSAFLLFILRMKAATGQRRRLKKAAALCLTKCCCFLFYIKIKLYYNNTGCKNLPKIRGFCRFGLADDKKEKMPPMR